MNKIILKKLFIIGLLFLPVMQQGKNDNNSFSTLNDSLIINEDQKNLSNEFIESSLCIEDSINNVLIPFNFVNENLATVVDYVAQEKKINIIFPIGGIKEKLNYSMPSLITVEAAWQLLITILDTADYIISEKNNEYHILRKTPETSLREPMPLFIGTQSNKLPNTDETIRYLYYLSNIKVSNEPDHEINVVLKELLSTNSIFRVDTSTNAIVIVDKASKIKDAMEIISRLDQASFQEKMEAVTLFHSDAKMVADLLNEGLLKSVGEGNKYHLDARKQNETQFFARGTKIIPSLQSNTLIIIGRAQAVEKIIAFVKDKIDTAPESGKSILHIFQLQYLNAASFEPVLRNIIETSRGESSGQSKAVNIESRGTERFFGEVIITSDKPSKDGTETKYWGGNKIVVACRNDDAKQIAKLIEELDTPQPQVILEILVADLTIDDTRSLGTLARNPQKIPILNTMQFQSAQLDPGVVLDRATNPTTIASDLLAPVFDANGVQTDPAIGNNSVAFFQPAGTTLVSLNDNDGKTFSITEVLQQLTTSRVISHPHIVAINNKKAIVRSGVERLLRDDTDQSPGGVAVIKFKKITAELKVEITPRISAGQTVNLQIEVTINDFIEGANNAQNTRRVKTNVNISSGSIFALGGLISVDNNQASNELPGWSEIPLFGWIFKKRRGEMRKTNLTVFISPTIVQPRLRRGVGEYTKDYIEVAKTYSLEGALFDNLRDPISRWFFSPPNDELDAEKRINEFLIPDELKIERNKITPPTRLNRKKNIPLNPVEKVVASLQEDINLHLEEKELLHLNNSARENYLQQETKNSSKLIYASEYQKGKDLKSLLKNDPSPFDRV